MKKAMIILLTAFLLTGCVGQNKTIEENQPNQEVTDLVNDPKQEMTDDHAKEDNKESVSIEDVGYTVRVDETERPFAYYGIILKNNNVEIAKEPVIVLSFKDDKGKVYMEQEQSLSCIYPGDRVVYSGIVDCGETIPTDIQFSCKFSETGKSEEMNAIKSSDLKIIDVKEESTNNITRFTGNIQNLSKQDIPMAVVTVLIKNKSKIVMGTNTFVMELNQGDSLSFELQEQDLPEHDEVIISALPFVI